ncbi:MAG: hypothetical protein KA998_03645 [Rickettsiaceae bacterium]|nr:hypothetical protein [Rickettsiaceae bacterium]
MKRSYLIFGGILSVILLYIALWFFVTNNIVKSVKNSLSANMKDSSQTLDVTSSGFPFKFGAKARSVNLRDESGATIYTGDMIVGYDLFRQSCFLDCKGTLPFIANSSLARMKGNDIEFDSLLINTKLPLSFSMIKALSNKDRNFEIVNFIKSADSKFVIVSRDHESKAIAYSVDGKIKIDIDNKSYYKTLDEMMGDTNPVKCNISLALKYDNSGFEYLSGTYSANSEITFPFKNPISNLHVTLSDIEASTLGADSKATIELTSNVEEKEYPLVGDFTLKIKGVDFPKERYFEFLNKSIVDNAAYALSNGVSPAIAPFLQDVVDHPEKYKFEAVKLEKRTSNLDLALKMNNGKFYLDVKELDIMFDDTGISTQNQSEFDKRFSWKTKGLLSVKNYASAFDYWSKYLTRAFPAEFNGVRVAIVGKAFGEFLRLVSDHPDSQNSTMVFAYEAGSDITGIKIGGKGVDQLASIYKQALYNQALQALKINPDLLEKLQEVVPEIASDKDLLNNLKKLSPKASTKPVIDSLINGVIKKSIGGN